MENFMCGIFAYTGTKNNGPKIVLQGIKELEYRGYDSWGVAVKIEAGEWWVKKQVGKIGQENGNDLPESDFAFGHTRWATHGGITQENAHPHLDCKKQIALIHNGIVENFEKLKEELLIQGHSFKSQTDSEVIVHLIEENCKQLPFEKAVIEAFKSLEGQSALIVNKVGEGSFIAVKNGSPLVLGFGESANYIASDSSALAPHTNKVYFLEDNEMANVSAAEIIVKEVKSEKVKRIKQVVLNRKLQAQGKGNYPHYMIKEIHEQPKVIEDIVKNVQRMDEITKDIQNHESTLFIGCGSAFHACLAAKEIFSQIAGRLVGAEVATDLKEKLSLMTKNNLIIALSQSGETMDILESIKGAKARGLDVDALVNVYGSSLYREAKTALLLQAGTEKAVASTKAFIAKLTILTLMAYKDAGKYEEGKNRLKRVSKSIEKLLAEKNLPRFKKIATTLKGKEHLFVVGRGMSFLSALEASLKIKEIAYIHAEGYRGSEIKHGPIALISKGSICLMFIPNDSHFQENISTAQELKARGGYIIGVSPHKNPCFDEHFEIEDLCEETFFLEVVFGQIVAYYLAVLSQLDPDMPRNLAKSVTVK